MFKERALEEMKEIFKENTWWIDHTFSKIDGVDFQIQWEADLLVNLETRPVRSDREKLKAAIEGNFKTTTGKTLACERYLK